MSLLFSSDGLVGCQIDPVFYIQDAREVFITSTDFGNPVTIRVSPKNEKHTIDTVHADSKGFQLRDYVDCRVDIEIPRNAAWDLSLFKCSVVRVSDIHARDLKLDIATTSYTHVSDSVVAEIHLSGPRIFVKDTHACVNMYVLYMALTTVKLENSSSPELGVSLELGTVELVDNQINLVNMICKLACISMTNHTANKIGISTTSGSVHIENVDADERFVVQTVDGYLDGSGECEIDFRTETGGSSYMVKPVKRHRG